MTDKQRASVYQIRFPTWESEKPHQEILDLESRCRDILCDTRSLHTVESKGVDAVLANRRTGHSCPMTDSDCEIEIHLTNSIH